MVAGTQFVPHGLQLATSLVAEAGLEVHDSSKSRPAINTQFRHQTGMKFTDQAQHVIAAPWPYQPSATAGMGPGRR